MLSSAPARGRTPFATLLLRRLHDHGVTEFPAGACLYEHHEPAGRFFLVIDGLVTIARIDGAGRETALDVRAAGDTFGDAALSAAPVTGERARALVRTKVRQWPAADVMALLARDGEVALAAARMLVGRAAQWRERLGLFGKEMAPRRLARTLLYLREKIGPVLPPLGDATFGALAGIPAESARRRLADFVRQGLIAATPAGVVVRSALADWMRDS